MNSIQAGLLAALPLSALGIAYMFWKGKELVNLVQTGSADTDAMTDQQWFYLMLGSLALAPFFFGMIAGLVYAKIGSPAVFLALALGLAVLFSILAVISRTPATGAKVAMNFLVAVDLGLLIPLLAGI